MTDLELAVELVTEPPPRPPRRWPQIALLVGALAVVIGVGLLDDGGDDETSLPSTTSTTLKRTTTTRRVHRVTTTTVLPRAEPGAGPLLADAVGTSLVYVDSKGLLTVVDLATGNRCVSSGGDREVWLPFSASSIGGLVPLQTPTALSLVDDQCVVRATASVNGYPIAAGAGAVWVLEDPGDRLVEVPVNPERASNRAVEIPSGNGAFVVAADPGLVVGVGGSMTLIDPTTSRRRDLGPGMPLAAHGNTLAFITCPRLACAVELLDLRTGTRRRLDPALDESVYGSATFSPDGRYLATSLPNLRVAIADLRTGGIVTSEAETVVGFTARSDWLLMRTSSRIIALRPDGTFERVITNGAGSNGAAVMLDADY